jgi:hypothetical protein
VDVGAPPVEGLRVKILAYLISSLAVVVLMVACASVFKYDKSAQLKKNSEFENAVKIERPADADSDDEAGESTPGATTTAPVAVVPAATPSPQELKLASKNKKKEKSGKKSKKAAAASTEPAAPSRRQPDLEDDTGFNGRRPVKDPFAVGEEVVHDMHYFKVSAGEMKLKVGPMSMVNGRKAYNFGVSIKSSSVFSSFYSVDDKVETFVDYETLTPSVFSLHVKETSQLREARMLFDANTNKATYWEKKVSKDKGEEEKKQAWDILPFSQNVYSAIFYMRNFQWDVGKEFAFRVADDEQNLIFKAKCLRKEKLDTKLGELDAVVLKPEIMLKGVFKPVGDIYIWLSDDEHHYVLRIESKIKIGTVISEVVSIKPGLK